MKCSWWCSLVLWFALGCANIGGSDPDSTEGLSEAEIAAVIDACREAQEHVAACFGDEVERSVMRPCLDAPSLESAAYILELSCSEMYDIAGYAFSMSCTSCTVSSQCEVGEYCGAACCLRKKPINATCRTNNQCMSGQCDVVSCGATFLGLCLFPDLRCQYHDPTD